MRRRGAGERTVGIDVDQDFKKAIAGLGERRGAAAGNHAGLPQLDGFGRPQRQSIGWSHFNLPQRALSKGGDRHATMLAVFDLPLVPGENPWDRPLTSAAKNFTGYSAAPFRKALSSATVLKAIRSTFSRRPCALGLEDVVSKRLDSHYRSGRREELVRTKCINTAEFIVIGYEPGGSYGGLRSLLLAPAKNGKLLYAGGVGTSFNSRTAPP